MATLKEIWESKGMSVEQVAGKADVSYATVYRVNRKQHVSPKSLRRVCEAVGISMDDYRNLDKSTS